MDYKEEICRRLVYLLDETHTRSSDLARAINVSPAAVTNWKNGKNSIELEKLLCICEFFNITLDEFMGEGGLSQDERKMMRAYRAADERAREDALKLLTSHKKAKDNE